MDTSTAERLANQMYKYAIRYGMPSDEFWFGHPQHFFIYEDAFREAEHRRIKEQDTNAWISNQYTLMALRDALTDIFAKGGHKDIYPSKPFIIKSEEQAKEQRQDVSMRDRFLFKVMELRKARGLDN